MRWLSLLVTGFVFLHGFIFSAPSSRAQEARPEAPQAVLTQRDPNLLQHPITPIRQNKQGDGGDNELAVDDGTFEDTIGLVDVGTVHGLNRLTPTGYPATLSEVVIFFLGDTGVQLGDALTVLGGTNPDGDAGSLPPHQPHQSCHCWRHVPSVVSDPIVSNPDEPVPVECGRQNACQPLTRHH